MVSPIVIDTTWNSSIQLDPGGKTLYHAIERSYFHLENDNDGHWYIIRDGLEKEFHQWVEAMENDLDWKGLDFDSFKINGSPSSVHFPSYLVETW